MSNTLKIEFEKLKADLIKAYDEKGMRASGDFANSLEVIQQNDNKIQLWGNDYAQQLETGRRSGKAPPRDAIEQWIEDKGIASRLNRDITKSQLAFLIARKIARQGWDRQGYGGVELISEVVTDDRIDKIIKEFGANKAIEFSNDILKLIKELA